MIMMVPFKYTGWSYTPNPTISSSVALTSAQVTIDSVSPLQVTLIPTSGVLSVPSMRTTPFIREVEGEIFWAPMFLLSGATDNNYISYALATSSNTGGSRPSGTQLLCENENSKCIMTAEPATPGTYVYYIYMLTLSGN
jgi:hypothetical protein